MVALEENVRYEMVRADGPEERLFVKKVSTSEFNPIYV